MENNEIDENTPEKLRKVVVRDKKMFVEMRNGLAREGKDFQTIITGTVDKVIYGGRMFMHMDMSYQLNKGFHLTNLFITDIKNWIAQNPKANLKAHKHSYREQMFNLDAIENSYGRQLVMVDINNCYWVTAYNLGYITQKTFIRGLRKKEWKMGRNACIGSLAKVTTIIPYKNGQPNYAAKSIVRTSTQMQNIRNHIIGHVYAIFNELFKHLKDEFYMFLTDCMVTDYKNLPWVEQFLLTKGYQIKHKPIEFLHLDRAKKELQWEDFGEERTNKAGEKVRAERKLKRMFYSSGQIIQSSLIAEPYQAISAGKKRSKYRLPK